MLFVRVDDKTFQLHPGLSRGCSDKRMEMTLEMVLEDIDPSCPDGIEAKIAYRRTSRFAKDIIRFAKKNPEYIFWEIFDFYGGKFSYAAKKELFFEDKRRGAHFQDALKEMRRRS
jgi:hypothetical protein